jgi:uncharacterized protein
MSWERSRVPAPPGLREAERFRPAAGRRIAVLVSLAFFLAAFLAAGLIPGSRAAFAAEPEFPQLTGRIVDQAGLLSAADQNEINTELSQLEGKSTDQVAVVTLKSLQGYAIEDYGYRLGRHWGIGQQGKNNGILLIVAPNDRKVRIEVGRGLEPIMTDALSRIIIDNAILPQFRRGDYAAGIRNGVRDIKDVLLGDAEAVKERARTSHVAQGMDTMQVILLLFWLAIVVYVIWAVYRSAQMANKSGLRRSGPVFFPSGSSDGWSGGGWSGGGGGGGGWSGGGGDFGGGGSSGSW